MSVGDMVSDQEAKGCCALAYESQWARLLLGDSLHPGGVDLTLRLGHLLALGRNDRVLDAACGRGTSAIALARAFGCSVHGIDLGAANIAAAREAAEDAGLDHLVTFAAADAEALPAGDASFDAVICECAFCTFPSKEAAASEFVRVLRPGGRMGLGDITCNGPVPEELETLIGWVACMAGALPAARYEEILCRAGAGGFRQEAHDEALAELASGVKFKLLGLEVLARVGKAPVALSEVLEAKRITKSAIASIREGLLGYSLMVGTVRDEGGGGRKGTVA